MTLFLSPLSGPSVVVGARTRQPNRRGSNSQRLAPPRGFNRIRGEISNVQWSTFSPPASLGHTAAQRAGIRYEKRIIEQLREQFTDSFISQKSIRFVDAQGNRVCIPDGILNLRGLCVVVEVKISHRELAWWQLRRLYEPVIRHLLRPNTPTAVVEICRSYDPDIRLPEPITVLDEIEAVQPGMFGVLPWKI